MQGLKVILTIFFWVLAQFGCYPISKSFIDLGSKKIPSARSMGATRVNG